MKVLFFDYWLKGVANFNRLVSELKHQDQEVEIKMLHVGSWKEHLAQPVSSHNGFLSYDISHYHTSSILKVLKKERPDVVVMLNIYLLLDKAVIAFCKKLGIKVVFVSHGRLSAATTATLGAKKTKKTLRDKLQKEPLLTLWNYAHSTLISRKPGNLIKTLLKVARHKFQIAYPSKFSEELDADEILVYYESDREVLHHEKDFPLEKVKVVGNPELDDFVNLPIAGKDKFISATGLDSPYLLYLDDGWVQAQLMEKDDWIKHITEVTRLAHDAGLRVAIKLHPRTPLEEYEDLFRSLDIKAFKNEVDFKSLIHYSDIVVSLASTTISLALFLNKRIISPRFGPVADIFLNYPENVIHYSHTPDDFRKWLVNDEPTVSDLKYLDDNFRWCDGKVAKRIVGNILNKS